MFASTHDLRTHVDGWANIVDDVFFILFSCKAEIPYFCFKIFAEEYILSL